MRTEEKPTEHEGIQIDSEPNIPPELIRQLLQWGVGRKDVERPSKRIPMETAKAASELVRLFIQEARSRASIEVCVLLPNVCPSLASSSPHRRMD